MRGATIRKRCVDKQKGRTRGPEKSVEDGDVAASTMGDLARGVQETHKKWRKRGEKRSLNSKSKSKRRGAKHAVRTRLSLEGDRISQVMGKDII